MGMERLSALDNVFLQLESEKTPMHVGGVLVFEPPSDRPAFAHALALSLRRPVACAPPFDRRLRRSPLPFSPASWAPVPAFEPGTHVFEAAVAEPGTCEDLWELVARLHRARLDLGQPPWECHVLTGLERGRFGIYYKVHHAAVDGVSGLRRMQNSLSAGPDDETPPLWQEKRTHARARSRPTRSRLKVGLEVAAALRAFVSEQRAHPDELPGLYGAPLTSMNRMLSERRTIRSIDLDLPRAHQIAADAGATVNDLALALVTGALRRYLGARGELPSRPLVAFVPVSLHDETSRDQLSNRVCSVLVYLPVQLGEARARLASIHAAMRRTKAFIRGLSPEANTALSMVGGMPALVGEMLGLTGLLPLPFNVVVSNVPGPRQPLYCSGARLEGLYPVSALFERQGLNVTLVSYLDRLSIGLLGCPDVCDLSAMTQAFSAAWEELAD